MIELLTAFATAGTTLHFIELGIKLLRGAAEILNAKNELAEEPSNLHGVWQALRLAILFQDNFLHKPSAFLND